MTGSNIRIVERAAEERVSGGYRYNDAVSRELQQRQIGALQQVEGAEALCGIDARVLLLDSLWLQWPAPRLRNGRQDSRQSFVLGHYFPPDNPTLSRGERDCWLRSAATWLSQCAGVLVTGERAAKSWSRHFPNLPLHVVPPAVTAKPRRDGPGDGPLQLVTLCGVLPAKIPLTFLEGMAQLATLDWRWNIVGSLSADPRHLRLCRAQLAAIDLSERVCFVGPQAPETALDYLRAADIYLAPSLFESFGMASAEALASGVPLVGFDTGDIHRWLPDDEACALVAAADATALLARLCAWLRAGRDALPRPGRPHLPMTDWAAVADGIVRAVSATS